MTIVNPPAGGAPVDPVLAKRARIARLVAIGKRIGYGLYLVAIVGFVFAFVTKPTDALVAIVIGTMVVGSVFLIPAIIFGYAVGAAEREDRKQAVARAARKRDAPQ